MNKEYNRFQRFLFTLIYLAMVFLLTNIIATVIEVDFNLVEQILLVIGIASAVKFFVQHPLFFIVFFTLGFLILFFIDRYTTPLFLPIASRMGPLFSNLFQNLKGQEVILSENLPIVYLLLVTLVSFYSSLVIYAIRKVSLLLPFYLSILLIYWYTFVDKAFNVITLFLLLFLILLGFRSYQNTNLKGPKVLNRWLITSISYSIIIIAIASMIPKTNNYLKWPYLQRKVYNRFPVVEELRYYKEYNRETASAELFNFSTTGFSGEDSELGGPLIQTEKEIMKVESDQPVYLRGNTKHYYTGRNWEEVNLDYGNTPLPTYGIGDRFNFISPEEEDLLFNWKYLTVTFDAFSSQTIFTPYMPIKVNMNKKGKVFHGLDDIISTDDGIYKDESYLVEYLQPLPYEKSIEAGANRSKDMLSNTDSIYLQVPDESITERTRQLTDSLVNEGDSDYEKSIKIQDYLRNNYKYELDVKEVPEGQEFIDHFLFEEQEGYCTYYASSMAVMLRLQGIPTRYVEGYIANEEMEDGRYQVRQKHAHTWVEAFIEPVGWMRFEPTAAYDDPTESGTQEETEEDEPFEEEMVPEKDNLPDTPDENIETDLEDEDLETSSKEKNQKDNRWTIVTISIIGIFSLLILIRILWKYTKYRRKNREFQSLDDKYKIIFLYDDIVQILALLGFPAKTGETHFEYANRISYKFRNLKGYGVKNITDRFVELKYSDREVESDDIKAFLEYKTLLDKRLRNHLGRWKYFYRKYINIYFSRKDSIP